MDMQKRSKRRCTVYPKNAPPSRDSSSGSSTSQTSDQRKAEIIRHFSQSVSGGNSNDTDSLEELPMKLYNYDEEKEKSEYRPKMPTKRPSLSSSSSSGSDRPPSKFAPNKTRLHSIIKMPKPRKTTTSLSSTSSDDNTNGLTKPKDPSPPQSEQGLMRPITTTLNTIENRIRVNLHNIKKRGEVRLSIRNIECTMKPKGPDLPPSYSIVTQAYVNDLRDEINSARPFTQTSCASHANELRAEIAQYRNNQPTGCTMPDQIDCRLRKSATEVTVAYDAGPSKNVGKGGCPGSCTEKKVGTLQIPDKPYNAKRCCPAPSVPLPTSNPCRGSHFYGEHQKHLLLVDDLVNQAETTLQAIKDEFQQYVKDNKSQQDSSRPPTRRRSSSLEGGRRGATKKTNRKRSESPARKIKSLPGSSRELQKPHASPQKNPRKQTPNCSGKKDELMITILHPVKDTNLSKSEPENNPPSTSESTLLEDVSSELMQFPPRHGVSIVDVPLTIPDLVEGGESKEIISCDERNLSEEFSELYKMDSDSDQLNTISERTERSESSCRIVVEEVKKAEVGTTKLSVQKMPQISIRRSLTTQKILNIEIKPSEAEIVAQNSEITNVKYLEIKHSETISEQGKPTSVLQIACSGNTCVPPPLQVKKSSGVMTEKIETCDRSVNTNAEEYLLPQCVLLGYPAEVLIDLPQQPIEPIRACPCKTIQTSKISVGGSVEVLEGASLKLSKKSTESKSAEAPITTYMNQNFQRLSDSDQRLKEMNSPSDVTRTSGGEEARPRRSSLYKSENSESRSGRHISIDLTREAQKLAVFKSYQVVQDALSDHDPGMIDDRSVLSNIDKDIYQTFINPEGLELSQQPPSTYASTLEIKNYFISKVPSKIDFDDHPTETSKVLTVLERLSKYTASSDSESNQDARRQSTLSEMQFYATKATQCESSDESRPSKSGKSVLIVPEVAERDFEETVPAEADSGSFLFIPPETTTDSIQNMVDEFDKISAEEEIPLSTVHDSQESIELKADKSSSDSYIIMHDVSTQVSGETLANKSIASPERSSIPPLDLKPSSNLDIVADSATVRLLKKPPPRITASVASNTKCCSPKRSKKMPDDVYLKNPVKVVQDRKHSNLSEFRPVPYELEETPFVWAAIEAQQNYQEDVSVQVDTRDSSEETDSARKKPLSPTFLQALKESSKAASDHRLSLVIPHNTADMVSCIRKESAAYFNLQKGKDGKGSVEQTKSVTDREVTVMTVNLGHLDPPQTNVPCGDNMDARNYFGVKSPKCQNDSVTSSSSSSARKHHKRRACVDSSTEESVTDRTSLSDGEIRCKCNASIGEIHLCKYAQSIKSRMHYLRRNPRKLLCYEFADPNIQIKHQRVFNNNWVAYYVSKGPNATVDNSETFTFSSSSDSNNLSSKIKK